MNGERGHYARFHEKVNSTAHLRQSVKSTAFSSRTLFVSIFICDFVLPSGAEVANPDTYPKGGGAYAAFLHFLRFEHTPFANHHHLRRRNLLMDFYCVILWIGWTFYVPIPTART